MATVSEQIICIIYYRSFIVAPPNIWKSVNAYAYISLALENSGVHQKLPYMHTALLKPPIGICCIFTRLFEDIKNTNEKGELEWVLGLKGLDI